MRGNIIYYSYCYNDYFQKNEMNWACSTHMVDKKNNFDWKT